LLKPDFYQIFKKSRSYVTIVNNSSFLTDSLLLEDVRTPYINGGDYWSQIGGNSKKRVAGDIYADSLKSLN
jgi:hypothetical protein